MLTDYVKTNCFNFVKTDNHNNNNNSNITVKSNFKMVANL